ncbi:MAG: hypothetical protein HC859_04965 [Bacteroidia bacterium]|nr:hypothetical protein [Bacteroidia bacterium]
MKKTWLVWPAVIALGATAGYLYWYYVGCNSGSCAITSSPVNSTLYGALLGGLLMNTFRRSRSTQSK